MSMRKDARQPGGKTARRARGGGGPYIHSEDNGRVVITAGERPDRPAGLVTSTDHSDRAHLSYDAAGFLRPSATDLDGMLEEPVIDTSFASRPRRYPQACCVAVTGGHGVPHDSMFDGWYAAARKLSAAGIEVGLGRARPGDDGPVDALRLADILGRRRLRALLRPRLRTGGESAAEMALTREASRLLLEAAGLETNRPSGGTKSAHGGTEEAIRGTPERKSENLGRSPGIGKPSKTPRRGQNREVAPLR